MICKCVHTVFHVTCGLFACSIRDSSVGIRLSQQCRFTKTAYHPPRRDLDLSRALARRSSRRRSRAAPSQALPALPPSLQTALQTSPAEAPACHVRTTEEPPRDVPQRAPASLRPRKTARPPTAGCARSARRPVERGHLPYLRTPKHAGGGRGKTPGNSKDLGPRSRPPTCLLRFLGSKQEPGASSAAPAALSRRRLPTRAATAVVVFCRCPRHWLAAVVATRGSMIFSCRVVKWAIWHLVLPVPPWPPGFEG